MERPVRVMWSVRIVAPIYTSQIIHVLVLATSSEYLLILAGLVQWNAIDDLRGGPFWG